MTVAMQVIAYLVDHPGQVFHYTEIAKAIDASPQVVNSYLSKQAREKPQLGIAREGGGGKRGTGSGRYRYVPQPAPEKSAELVPALRTAAAPAPVPAPPVNGHTAARPGDLFEYAGHIDGTGVVRHPVTWELYRLERIAP